MRRSDLHEGDRVKVNHQGRRTTATVTGFDGRLVLIAPDSHRFTWRRVPAREVTDVLSTRWTPSHAASR